MGTPSKEEEFINELKDLANRAKEVSYFELIKKLIGPELAIELLVVGLKVAEKNMKKIKITPIKKKIIRLLDFPFFPCIRLYSSLPNLIIQLNYKIFFLQKKMS